MGFGLLGCAAGRYAKARSIEASELGGGAVLLDEAKWGYARVGQRRVHREGRARRGPRAGLAVRRVLDRCRREGWVAWRRAMGTRGAAQQQAGPAGRRSMQAGRVDAGRRPLVAGGSERKERGRVSVEGKREREIE